MPIRRRRAVNQRRANITTIHRMGTRSTLQRIQRQLNFLKPEKKQIVFSMNQVSIDNAGVDNTLNAIAQGTGQADRVGNSVKFSGYWGRFSIYFPDSPNFFRVIVYSPKNEGDTMFNDSVTVTGVYDMDKYNVYYDKMFSGDGTAGNATRSLTIRKKWKNGKKQQYNGPASGNIVSGRLILYCVSDSGAVSHPYITGSLRLYYVDV